MKLRLFLLIWCVIIYQPYPVNAWMNVATVGGGGVPVTSATIDFGADLGRFEQTSDASTTTALTVGVGGIAQGTTVAIISRVYSSSQTLTGVTDSRSNTYTVHKDYLYNTSYHVSIITAYLSTALQSGDTITINWGTPNYSYRSGDVVTFTGVASTGQPDQTAEAATYGTSISAAASTTATATALVGIVAMETSQTYSSSSWTVLGAVHTYGGTNSYYVYKVASASGSQDPGGTASANNTWGAAWVALK